MPAGGRPYKVSKAKRKTSKGKPAGMTGVAWSATKGSATGIAKKAAKRKAI